MLRIRDASGCAVALIGLVVVAAGCTTRVVPPLEPPMTVRRADEAFKYQEYQTAVEYYKAYLDRTWQGEYTAISAYQCALAEYRLRQYQATIATLNDLEKRYPDTHWIQVQALRGDAERALGNDTLALLEWDEGWDLGSEDDQSKLRLRIVTLAKRMSPEKLASARQLVVNDDVRELLYPGGEGGTVPPVLAAPMPEQDEGVDSETSFRPAAAPAPPTEAQLAAAQADKLEPMPPAEPAGRQGESEPESPPAPQARSAPSAADLAYLQGNKSGLPRTSRPSSADALPAATAPADAESDEMLDDRGMTAGDGLDAGSPAVVAAVPPAAPESPPAGPPAVEGARLGVLLPMSGRNDDLGQRAWSAIQLAFGDQRQRLLLKDTGDDSGLTRRALNDLWHDPHVVAVVGPVAGADAEAVAELAEQDALPLLPLSQQDGLDGQFVLQMGMTRSELVENLLDYAVQKARLQRFGMLYPDDANGRAFLKTFRSALEQRGGTIVGTAAYPPGANVVPRYASTLFQWRDKGDLQALFLADTSGTAARVGPFLQGEMPDVALLGVQGWQRLAGEVGLNGVFFADGFYAGSTRPATQAFVQRYREAYGQTPGGLEARAYDAGTLARRALDAGAGTRSEMIQQLRALGTVDGATGTLRVTPSGLQRSVFLLRLYQGRLEEIGTVG